MTATNPSINFVFLGVAVVFIILAAIAITSFLKTHKPSNTKQSEDQKSKSAKDNTISRK